MIIKLRNNGGFTLVEVLIGMTIMVLLIFLTSQILLAAMTTYRYNMAIANNKLIIRNTLNVITDELRYASAITNPVFTANTPTSANAITYTLNNQACNIALNQNTITIVSGTTTRELARNTATALNFTRNGQVNEVIVSITVNDGSYTGSPNTTLDTVVIIPNLR